MDPSRHFCNRRLRGALIAAIFISAVSAQPTAGTIQGSLSDSSGAVIPAASITLSGGGVNRSAQTQADGSYTFSGVTPGPYTVAITIPGFVPFSQAITVSGG